MNIKLETDAANFCYETGTDSILGSRQYQQDFAYVYMGEKEILAAVCDGMGGMEGGERASSTAVFQLAEDFHLFQENPQQSVPDFFTEEAKRLNQSVRSLKNTSGKSIKAGTTLVAAWFCKNEMYWVSVGDSRIWLVRNGQIHQVNRDHNYRLSLEYKLQNGEIDRREFERESHTPQAEALISYIGIENLRLIDVNRTPIRLEEGDIVILSSDGVYKSLNDVQVCAMVCDNDIDMNIAAARLNAMALRYGVRGQDNTTSVLIRYFGEPEESEAWEPITERGESQCDV